MLLKDNTIDYTKILDYRMTLSKKVSNILYLIYIQYSINGDLPTISWLFRICFEFVLEERLGQENLMIIATW